MASHQVCSGAGEARAAHDSAVAVLRVTAIEFVQRCEPTLTRLPSVERHESVKAATHERPHFSHHPDRYRLQLAVG